MQECKPDIDFVSKSPQAVKAQTSVMINEELIINVAGASTDSAMINLLVRYKPESRPPRTDNGREFLFRRQKQPNSGLIVVDGHAL